MASNKLIMSVSPSLAFGETLLHLAKVLHALSDRDSGS
ncbi:hypothetical protein Nizo1839_1000 [Lactiplantibacillus plantarum]|nr:hypothetical protein SF2A35B_1245 [Lactiplantibacillus plantarum]KZT81709.1 hypothetical protein Nizo1839_1000 [Lactiplantibacillus plantarum]KZU16505.1 hypothetical protein Nizo2264_0059 [Lactiplantibacillus plantarum]